jgi:hypothetical protein
VAEQGVVLAARGPCGGGLLVHACMMFTWLPIRVLTSMDRGQRDGQRDGYDRWNRSVNLRYKICRAEKSPKIHKFKIKPT